VGGNSNKIVILGHIEGKDISLKFGENKLRLYINFIINILKLFIRYRLHKH